MKRLTRYLWPILALALPIVLLHSSLLTLREFDELRRVYLRNRAATLAAFLETLPPDRAADALENEEPALVDFQVFDPAEKGPDAPALDPIWRGQALYRTEELTTSAGKLFRAYIPFHSQGRLRIARIDLAASAADFLVAHARHNVLISFVAALVLLALTLYALWSARRNARLERRHLELQHLAHLGTLSAVLAHEIRNPLGTIKGFAQLAAEKADPATNALLSPIVGETRRLERLVNDLLLYGRSPEPLLCATDCQTLAAELEANAREAIAQRPIRFSCTPEHFLFRTDPDLLKQILLNLVRNSIDAIGDGPGEIRVTAARTGAAVRISVEDNGPGLPEAAQKRLFEPFFTTKASGTGLGLSIARKLSAALGATLDLHPVQPHGVRAELVFPQATTWQPS